MAITFVLLAAVFFVLWALSRKDRKELHEAPGPFQWPIIGNLHQLGGQLPYKAFTELKKKFGPVYSLQLGSVPAVVVNDLENIKQVLYHKLNHFDSRPNFNRYHQLFDGDKNNSLAFCDWSDVQRKRREILNDHTFPKVYSNNFKELSTVISDEVKELVINISQAKETVIKRKSIFSIPEPEAILSKNMKRLLGNKHISTFVRLPSIEEVTEEEPKFNSEPFDVKAQILQTTASIFLRYFCSFKTEKNQDLNRFVKDFDKVFYEVNQGYASDFLPFLEGIVGNNAKEMRQCSENIRKYVDANIIQNRFESLEKNSEEKDYIDALLKNVKFGDDVQMDMDTALFCLEDILGGHSAIGNFLMKVLTFIVDNDEVQNNIMNEVKQLGKNFVSLEDRERMPYTESVIMEALRLIASPIVPHVANQDTQISGFDVKKGTLIFLNNYDLNMSETLWNEPEKFKPNRFLDETSGARVKPAHFLPFGGGRRSCMGYKLVQFVGFVVIANLVNSFKIKGIPGQEYHKVPIGNLALPEDTFKFDFQTR